jgi:hypothetical protein
MKPSRSESSLALGHGGSRTHACGAMTFLCRSGMIREPALV